MPCASVVALTRLAIEPGSSPYTYDSSSEIYDFNGETLQKHGTIMHAYTIRGTRSEAKERSRLRFQAAPARQAAPGRKRMARA
mgnify:CR=1 FL=1